MKTTKIKQKRLLAYVPPKLPEQEVKNYRKVSDILLQFQGSAQERQQLGEALITISKTKTGAQYIGNFPKDWKLGIVSRDAPLKLWHFTHG